MGEIKVLAKNITSVGQLRRALDLIPSDTELYPFGSDKTKLIYKPDEEKAFLDETFTFLNEDELNQIDD